MVGTSGQSYWLAEPCGNSPLFLFLLLLLLISSITEAFASCCFKAWCVASYIQGWVDPGGLLWQSSGKRLSVLTRCLWHPPCQSTPWSSIHGAYCHRRRPSLGQTTLVGPGNSWQTCDHCCLCKIMAACPVCPCLPLPALLHLLFTVYCTPVKALLTATLYTRTQHMAAHASLNECVMTCR